MINVESHSSPKYINCMGFTHLSNLCTHVLYVVLFDNANSKMVNMRSKIENHLNISPFSMHTEEKSFRTSKVLWCICMCQHFQIWKRARRICIEFPQRIHNTKSIQRYKQYLNMRESVDSLCRDGTDTPIVRVHRKAFLTHERLRSKPFWAPGLPILFQHCYCTIVQGKRVQTSNKNIFKKCWGM